MRVLLVPFLLAASAASADSPITAERFESIVTGKTFTYGTNGIPYGAEAYYDNRRVQWTFLDGECQEGKWFAYGEQICFLYDTVDTQQCWLFFERGGRLSAQYVGDHVSSDFYEIKRQSDPLQCLGPKVGV